MDAVTALSGSGPAYFALLAEAMIEAGILLGLPRNLAADLVIQTAVGSAVTLTLRPDLRHDADRPQADKYVAGVNAAHLVVAGSLCRQGQRARA